MNASTRQRKPFVMTTAGLALAIGLCVVTPSAHAQTGSTSEVDQLYLEGVMLYKAGRYKSAIERFEKAYGLYPDPKLLYNIGRCQESRGELELALRAYQHAAEHENASDQLKAKAQRRMRLVEQVQQRSRKVLEKPTEPSVPAQSSDAINTPREPRSIPAMTAALVPPPQPERRTSALTVMKWVTGGVGLGLVAGGVTSILLGVADANKIDDAIDATEAGGTVQMRRVHALELQDDANTKKIVGYALAGAGAAAIIGSAVMFYFDGGSRGERKGRDDGAHSRGINVSFAYRPGGAALGLQGSF